MVARVERADEIAVEVGFRHPTSAAEPFLDVFETAVGEALVLQRTTVLANDQDRRERTTGREPSERQKRYAHAMRCPGRLPLCRCHAR
jgi:hypothetical protein